MHDRYEQILQFGGLTAVGSVHTPSAPAQQVLDRLIRGNCGYRNRQTNPAPITQSLRRSMAEQGQKPCAVILTCADSRVPPEHIFHAGLGELFVIRNAGNLMGYYSLGSVEYAVQHLNAPLVVVMGHTGCGAVHAAMHEQANGALGWILDSVRAHLGETRDVRLAERRNLLANLAHVGTSRTLCHLYEIGKVDFAAAMYDIHTGHVDFLYGPAEETPGLRPSE